MNKQQVVFQEVEKLYKNSQRQMAHWMWKHHVQLVAQNASELAVRFNANLDFCYCGALLHDLGDVWFERSDPKFEITCRDKGRQILGQAGFTNEEIATILVEVIEPHSCHPDNSPKILDGKILATADALAHLKSNFYHELKRMRLPKTIPPEKFDTWVQKKLDRDFNNKIFFDEIRREVKPLYERLLKDFQLI